MKYIITILMTTLFTMSVNANERQWNGSFFEVNPNTIEFIPYKLSKKDDPFYLPKVFSLKVGAPIMDFWWSATYSGHKCGDVVQIGNMVVVCGHKSGSDSVNGQSIQGYSKDGETISKFKIGCSFIRHACDVDMKTLDDVFVGSYKMEKFTGLIDVSYKKDNVEVTIVSQPYDTTPYEFVFTLKPSSLF